MRLTKKKAIEITIELWTWLAETGKGKGEWPEWKKYGVIRASCPLCEYVERKNADCDSCILVEQLGRGCYELRYAEWINVYALKTRKKYASLFLEQLRRLK